MDSLVDSPETANTSSIIEWTPEHEKIFVEWADKAMCFRWLHSKAHGLYSYLNAWYTIPVIIISTLTGTANFAQDRVPIQYQGFFVMFVGGFNILAGIITTIQQFLKITQLNEAHRVSSIAWDKFYRNIKIELAKHPDERININHMIKMCKDEYDRLMETSPIIPEKIIQMFKNEFSKYDSMDGMPKIITPEICDSLVSTELSRNPWSSQDNINRRLDKIRHKEKEKEKETMELIHHFQKTFYNIHNRDPLETEMIDNLKDKLDIDILMKVLLKINQDKHKHNHNKYELNNIDKNIELSSVVDISYNV